MKTNKISETETNLRLKPRQTESVSIEIPLETMESLRRAATHRDMSESALLKVYIGSGLRQDLSSQYATRLKEKTASVLARHIASQEEVANILREIQAEVVH